MILKNCATLFALSMLCAYSHQSHAGLNPFKPKKRLNTTQLVRKEYERKLAEHLAAKKALNEYLAKHPELNNDDAERIPTELSLLRAKKDSLYAEALEAARDIKTDAKYINHSASASPASHSSD